MLPQAQTQEAFTRTALIFPIVQTVDTGFKTPVRRTIVVFHVCTLGTDREKELRVLEHARVRADKSRTTRAHRQLSVCLEISGVASAKGLTVTV